MVVLESQHFPRKLHRKKSWSTVHPRFAAVSREGLKRVLRGVIEKAMHSEGLGKEDAVQAFSASTIRIISANTAGPIHLLSCAATANIP